MRKSIAFKQVKDGLDASKYLFNFPLGLVVVHSKLFGGRLNLSELLFHNAKFLPSLGVGHRVTQVFHSFNLLVELYDGQV